MSPFKQALLIVFVVVLLPLQGFAAETITCDGNKDYSPTSGSSLSATLCDPSKAGGKCDAADGWQCTNEYCTDNPTPPKKYKSSYSAGVCNTAFPNTCPNSDSCTIYCSPKGNPNHYYIATCKNASQTYAWAQGFLKNFLEPFYEMIIIVARLIGIFLVIWGLMRVRRHGQHNMMYRLSPMATAMFFVVGAVFAAFMPFALSFSGGIFGNTTIDATNFKNSTGLNQNLVYKCSEGGGNTSAADLSGAVYCPVLGYANEVDTNKGSLQDDPQKAMMQVVYAVLLVIGVISFLRGFLFLLRMGEGNSQEGSMQKAVTHIIAGVIGMNAQSFQDLLTGALPSHTGT